MQELHRTDDAGFIAEIDTIVKESEAMRVRYMQSHQNRQFVSITLGLLLLVAGACGFGWFFLVEGKLGLAIASIVGAAILPWFLHRWSRQPLKAYIKDYKRLFMPKLAEMLGGFRYAADGGIGVKILQACGVLPPHDRYHCEDCFMGFYKGIKVIFSESRLYKGGAKNFEGLFILLELSNPLLEGHIILTADHKMAEKYAASRWQKLVPVPRETSNPAWNRFLIYADTPEHATLLVGDPLLKELSEAADIFSKAPLTAVLFKQKYIFLMIPHSEDMFEASDIELPVPTREHALSLRREIEKVLELMDVFDIYQVKSERGAPSAPPQS
ncbi:MAG: DUF3137 domain-containing protein [Alphaproteobacteria bacterium]|nr:DUF3137 domain-containing protein [Alphaproteobacteria bacterium]